MDRSFEKLSLSGSTLAKNVSRAQVAAACERMAVSFAATLQATTGSPTSLRTVTDVNNCAPIFRARPAATPNFSAAQHKNAAMQHWPFAGACRRVRGSP